MVIMHRGRYVSGLVWSVFLSLDGAPFLVYPGLENQIICQRFHVTDSDMNYCPWVLKISASEYRLTFPLLSSRLLGAGKQEFCLIEDWVEYTGAHCSPERREEMLERVCLMEKCKYSSAILILFDNPRFKRREPIQGLGSQPTSRPPSKPWTNTVTTTSSVRWFSVLGRD